MNGHKYYIVGITIVVDKDCIFDTFHLAQNQHELYDELCKLDQEELKTKMIMMDPIHAEVSKSTVSSDYVVPAVRGILDRKRDVIGYAVLYFDYGVIEQIFAANLPGGSYFQVVNRNQSIIFSNCGDELIDMERPEKGFVYNKYEATGIGWTFTMALPADFYLNSLQQTTFATGILMAVIFVAAVIVIAFLISKITSEITNLRDSMHQVSAGNLNVVYEIQGRDEIAQMGETFNHMVSRIDMLMKKVTEEEKEKRLVEISFLEAQINPHFVSNILNNVTWMAKMQHADNIVPLVQSLNSMLQNVMHQEEDMILLKNELLYVENYLKIVEYSGSHDCEVEKEIAPETENLLVLRFILQPILENAINHGLAGSLSKQEKIIIRSYLEHEKLILTIEDNGNRTLFSPIMKKMNCGTGEIPASLWKQLEFEQKNQKVADLSTLNEFFDFMEKERIPRKKVMENCLEMLRLLHPEKTLELERLSERIRGYEIFELFREDIMDYMNRERIEVEKERYRYSALVNQVIEYVWKNYSEDISLELCAEQLESSYTHLSRAFKQETGMRFVEYLNEQRVNRAKSLLIRGELPMKEIVEQSGFCNYNYFFKVFKEMTEMKPGEFAAKI